MCAMPHVEGGLYVSGDSAGKRTCGVPSLWRRREDRWEVLRNAKQCICGGIVHSRCVNENTGALCECNLPQVLVHRFQKWQKSQDHATGQRRAAIVKQKQEQVAAQDKWQPGTKVWRTGLRRAELNGADGSVQGEENGRVLEQLDHQKGGRTMAIPHDHLSGLPLGNGNSRAVRSKLVARKQGEQEHKGMTERQSRHLQQPPTWRRPC